MIAQADIGIKAANPLQAALFGTEIMYKISQKSNFISGISFQEIFIKKLLLDSSLTVVSFTEDQNSPMNARIYNINYLKNSYQIDYANAKLINIPLLFDYRLNSKFSTANGLNLSYLFRSGTSAYIPSSNYNVTEIIDKTTNPNYNPSGYVSNYSTNSLYNKFGVAIQSQIRYQINKNIIIYSGAYLPVVGYFGNNSFSGQLNPYFNSLRLNAGVSVKLFESKKNSDN